MTEQTTHALQPDTALDALLAAADAAVLDRVSAALDIDAGRAAIFAPSAPPEEVPENGGDGDESELESILAFTSEDIVRWLAISGPGFLPQQLDKAASTVRTMTVVGRALLPCSMRRSWGLATDFLTEVQDRLSELKSGLARRELCLDQALDLQLQACQHLERFAGALRQAAQGPHGPKAGRVSERLIATAEMTQTLLGWTRGGIEALFRETDHPLHSPVR